jgi:hypothetical protein
MVRSYTAVWRPGTGEQRWWSGSPANFKSADKGYLSKGLRLVTIDRDDQTLGAAGWAINFTHEDRIIGVWRPGSGEERWCTGMSVDDFKQLDDDHFANGLRLRSVDKSGSSVSAVWNKGSGEQRWASGLSVDEFTKKDAAYFERGLRLVAIDIDDDEYFAVWRPGSGGQRWFCGSFDAFKAKDSKYFEDGLRLVAFDHHDGKYVGVWQPGSGAQYWYTGLTVAEFKAKDAEMFAKGLRMVAVDMGRVEQKSAPTTTPGGGDAVTRSLVMKENAPASGAGGDGTWMYYTGTVSSSDPLHGKMVTKVENTSSYKYILAHNGVSTAVLDPHEKVMFAAGSYGGQWSAELLDVAQTSAPPSLTVSITMQ